MTINPSMQMLRTATSLPMAHPESERPVNPVIQKLFESAQPEIPTSVGFLRGKFRNAEISERSDKPQAYYCVDLRLIDSGLVYRTVARCVVDKNRVVVEQVFEPVLQV